MKIVRFGTDLTLNILIITGVFGIFKFFGLFDVSFSGIIGWAVGFALVEIMRSKRKSSILSETDSKTPTIFGIILKLTLNILIYIFIFVVLYGLLKIVFSFETSMMLIMPSAIALGIMETLSDVRIKIRNNKNLAL